jgi:hypothetical protein
MKLEQVVLPGQVLGPAQVPVQAQPLVVQALERAQAQALTQVPVRVLRLHLTLRPLLVQALRCN